MKSLVKKLALCALLGAAVGTNAATVSVDPGASWQGFMNVSETPAHGGGYVYGSGWGTADLVGFFNGANLMLAPNSIGDPNPFWYTPGGGPGSVGNKIMDANLYVETTGLFSGQTLNFTGIVLANTLFGHTDANGYGWTSVAFIKDFAPDYSSFNTITAPLVNGVFDISLATINDPTRHVQYGFETIGPDVWITDVGPYGSISVTTIPEPASLALAGLGAALLLLRRRRV